jgi:uncharacterized protein YkwD
VPAASDTPSAPAEDGERAWGAAPSTSTWGAAPSASAWDAVASTSAWGAAPSTSAWDAVPGGPSQAEVSFFAPQPRDDEPGAVLDERAPARSTRRRTPVVLVAAAVACTVIAGVTYWAVGTGATSTSLAGAVPPGAALAVSDVPTTSSDPATDTTGTDLGTSGTASSAPVLVVTASRTAATRRATVPTSVPTSRTASTTTTTAGTTSSSTSAAAPLGAFAQEVLDLTNAQRAQNGCQALTANATLTSVAQAHSADMAARGFFDHINPDGRSPFDRMSAAGYSYSLAAENIAAGQATPAAVVDAWMNSSGHRANILNCKLTELGVGYATGGSYGTYWTQDFGTPA